MGRAPKREDGQLYTERVPMFMTKSQVESIDDWRAERRIWSRSEAIKQLVNLGLAAAATEGGRDAGTSD